MKTSPLSSAVSDSIQDSHAADRRRFAQDSAIASAADSAGVVLCPPRISVLSKVAVRHRLFARISGFVVPARDPLKVSSDRLGTVAEFYKQARRFAPRNASAGVIITNPASQPSGAGTGFLTVVWTASQAGLAGQAQWWINPASPHPIPTSGIVLGVGNTTVSFGPLAGYTAPAPVLIHIWRGQTTTLTVTYGQP